MIILRACGYPWKTGSLKISRATAHSLQIQDQLARDVRALLVVAAILLVSSSQAPFNGRVPFTGSSDGRFPEQLSTNDTPSLTVFRSTVMNGIPDELTGVWVEGLLAYEVVAGDGANVPHVPNTAALYDWASKRGVTALMIHNNLGGTALYELEAGMRIAAVYGDGHIIWYVASDITAYEASSYSAQGFKGPFRAWDCERCAFDYSVEDIQANHYTGRPHLAFQTCLEGSGRMGFIVLEAEPLAAFQYGSPSTQ